jgi:hypothetical protein
VKRTHFLALTLGTSLLCLPALAAAQANPTLNEAERGIRTEGADTARHLRIDELKAQVNVVGKTADVTLELLISSDSAAPYEANLALIMPSDAVVTGYALDVGGTLIPGQLLEQPKARNVYEDEVRAGIDPGLAEVSRENLFTTRIFPIDSGHPRRFRLTFSAPFDPDKGLLLPLMRDTPIARIDAQVRVEGYDQKPDILFAGKPLALTRAGQGWEGATRSSGATLTSGLVVTGGKLAAPMVAGQHPNGERFFLINDQTSSAPPSAKGGRLRIYWDRSLSHRDDQLDQEIDVLAQAVERLAPKGIDLVTFASDAPQTATIADAAALRTALHAVTYRGGTSLARLDGIALPVASECIMVFDGQLTIDKGTVFAPDCRLSLLTSSREADGARLARMAQASGGSVVRLSSTTRSTDAAASLMQNAVTVKAVRDDKGNRINVRALPAAAGGWSLVGPMPQSGKVTVQFNGGDARTYSPGAVYTQVAAPAALWAANRVGELADDPARHQTMAELAQRYQVASPTMAFLVLERPDQYVKADIVPPRGFTPAWMTEYQTTRKAADADKAQASEARFAQVLDRWNDRKLWWGKTYTANKPIRDRDGKAIPPPPPPAPAAPSPMANTPVAAEADAAMAPAEIRSIMVTAQKREAVKSSEEKRTVEPPRPIALELADMSSKQPYMAALNAAGASDRLKVLADQQLAYGTMPAFYLDTAEWFRAKGDATTAELLLFSALELPGSDDETRQIVAFRLERDQSFDRAVELAESLAAVNAEFRPQPARSLALALIARGRSLGAGGRADLERAFRLLTTTALNPASSDFDGIEVIALMEANALIPEIEALGGTWTLDPRLVALLDTDVRIVIEWTAADSDIDLWVDEPNGERVYYSHPLSSAGGHISNDMTSGYGPEEYVIRRAPQGAYAVRINGFRADRINPNGPGHVLIRLIRNHARKSSQQTLVDADLGFQTGSDRNAEGGARPVATLRVGEGK